MVTEGAYDIETEDDIFRGKESVDLQGGVVRASARGEKGKGVSSDGAVTLAGGSYVFAYTSEGIEGKTIEMSGGSFDISADDDGMNAREHYDKEQTETKKKEADPEVWVHITGGELHVTAGGDGIDSNGDLIFSGGMSFVNGSDNGKDAALDWNGSCRVDGGVLIASGRRHGQRRFRRIPRNASLSGSLRASTRRENRFPCSGETAACSTGSFRAVPTTMCRSPVRSSRKRTRSTRSRETRALPCADKNGIFIVRELGGRMTNQITKDHAKGCLLRCGLSFSLRFGSDEYIRGLIVCRFDGISNLG